METYKYKCFGSDQQTGNVAYVIIDEQMSGVERQNFATQINVPVVVFIDKIANDVVNVSFYYPHKISPLCLHGSLATAKFLFSTHTSLQQLTIESSFGKKILATKNNDAISLQMNFEYIQDGEQYREQTGKLLNINTDNIANKIIISSVGSPKLLVEVKSKDALFDLSPDLQAIDSWNKQTCINGIYAYCHHDGKIYARNFNHLDAKLEDSATCVAASALCYYLKRNIAVLQGYNLANPCQLNVVYDLDKIALSGLVTSL